MTRRPFKICRARHEAVVEAVSFPHPKIVFVAAGWTRLEHRGRGTLLAAGDVAFLPARALVSGVPLPVAETVTFYLDPQFIEQQLAWVRTVAPLGAAFRAAAAGTGPILSLRPSAMERRTLIAQARTLAACDASIECVSLGMLGACPELPGSYRARRVPGVVSPSHEVRCGASSRRCVATLHAVGRWTI